MKVYRVALPPDHKGNGNGKWIGPYNARTESRDEKVRAVSFRLSREHGNDEHPSPWEDVPGGINRKEVCLFTSIEQMEEWFQTFGFDLTEAGYKVLTYETDAEIRHGRHQSVANVRNEEITSIESPLGYIE